MGREGNYHTIIFNLTRRNYKTTLNREGSSREDGRSEPLKRFFGLERDYRFFGSLVVRRPKVEVSFRIGVIHEVELC